MNVIEIISDQHQGACLGCAGHPQVLTPNLDRLAATGTFAPNAYTQNTICTPSRVNVLSGQYCHNHGYYGLVGPAPANLPSFLGHFRQHGYRTAIVGKTHLPNNPQDWLLQDDACDFWMDCNVDRSGDYQGSPYLRWLGEQGLLVNGEFPDQVTVTEGYPSALDFEHSSEHWTVQQAIGFIDRDDDRPFCMQVSLPRPHTRPGMAMTAAPEFWDLYADIDTMPPVPTGETNSGRPPHFQWMADWLDSHEWVFEPRSREAGLRRLWRGYLAAVSQVDAAVGLLLDHLDRRGLAEDTIIVYHADHGSYSGSFGLREKAPGICSDLICRIPMIWRVPGTTPPGTQTPHFVENVDIAPTITALCDLPPMTTVDGHDLTGLLAGDDAPVREVAVTENPWSRSLRWDRWRFVHYQPGIFDGADVGELYDLENDPHETRNLYTDPEYAAVVAECRRRLLDWWLGTTRFVTVWPALAPDGEKRYEFAADGKEANTAGPALRVRSGLDEFTNYL